MRKIKMVTRSNRTAVFFYQTAYRFPHPHPTPVFNRAMAVLWNRIRNFILSPAVIDFLILELVF